LVSAL
jgi:hypothetical protein